MADQSAPGRVQRAPSAAKKGGMLHKKAVKDGQDPEASMEGPGGRGGAQHEGPWEAMDEEYSSVCAACDDGGGVVVCEGGRCMRAFHIEADCNPLKLNTKAKKRLATYIFTCPNCITGRQNCFVCKREGLEGKDVFQCKEKGCGRFFHPECVGERAESMEQGKFVCPSHTCAACGQKGHGEPVQWTKKSNGGWVATGGGLGELVPCVLCLQSFHEAHLPKECPTQYCGCQTGGRCPKKGGHQPRRVWSRNWTRNGTSEVETSLLYCSQHTIEVGCFTPDKTPLFSKELLKLWNEKQFQKTMLVHEYKRRKEMELEMPLVLKVDADVVQVTDGRGCEALEVPEQNRATATHGKDVFAQPISHVDDEREAVERKKHVERDLPPSTRRTRAKKLDQENKVLRISPNGMVDASTQDPLDAIHKGEAKTRSLHLESKPQKAAQETSQSKAAKGARQTEVEGKVNGLIVGDKPSLDGAILGKGVDNDNQHGPEDCENAASLPENNAAHKSDSMERKLPLEVPHGGNVHAPSEGLLAKQTGGEKTHHSQTKRDRKGILMNIFANLPGQQGTMKTEQPTRSTKASAESGKGHNFPPIPSNIQAVDCTRSKVTGVEPVKAGEHAQAEQRLLSAGTVPSHQAKKHDEKDVAAKITSQDREHSEVNRGDSKSDGDGKMSQDGETAAGSETLPGFASGSLSIHRSSEADPGLARQVHATGASRSRAGFENEVLREQKASPEISDRKASAANAVAFPASPCQVDPEPNEAKNPLDGEGPRGNRHQVLESNERVSGHQAAREVKIGRGSTTQNKLHSFSVQLGATEIRDKLDERGDVPLDSAGVKVITPDWACNSSAADHEHCAAQGINLKDVADSDIARPPLSPEEEKVCHPQKKSGSLTIQEGTQAHITGSAMVSNMTKFCRDTKPQNWSGAALGARSTDIGGGASAATGGEGIAGKRSTPNMAGSIGIAQGSLEKSAGEDPVQVAKDEPQLVAANLMAAKADGSFPHNPANTAHVKSGSSGQASVKLKCLSDAGTSAKEGKPSGMKKSPEATRNNEPGFDTEGAFHQSSTSELNAPKETNQVCEQIEKDQAGNAGEPKQDVHDKIPAVHSGGGLEVLPVVNTRRGPTGCGVETSKSWEKQPDQQRDRNKIVMEAPLPTKDPSLLEKRNDADTHPSAVNRIRDGPEDLLAHQHLQEEAVLPDGVCRSSSKASQRRKRNRSDPSGPPMAASTPRQGPSVMRMAKFFDCMVSGEEKADEEDLRTSKRFAQEDNTLATCNTNGEQKNQEDGMPSDQLKQHPRDESVVQGKSKKHSSQNDPAPDAQKQANVHEDALKRPSLDSATGPYSQAHSTGKPPVQEMHKTDTAGHAEPSTSQGYAPSLRTPNSLGHTHTKASLSFPPKRVCMMLRDILRPDDVVLDFNCKTNEYHEAMIDLTRDAGMHEVQFLSFSARKIKHSHRQKHHQCNWLEVVVGSLKVPGERLVVGFCPPLQDVMVADLYIKHAARFRPRLLVIIAKRASIIPHGYVVTYENGVGFGTNDDSEETSNMSLCRSSGVSTESDALVLRIMKRADLPLFQTSTWEFLPVV